jgi:hypothetical protein
VECGATVANVNLNEILVILVGILIFIRPKCDSLITKDGVTSVVLNYIVFVNVTVTVNTS